LGTSVNRLLQEQHRPIISIGQSLGGWVIKQVGNFALLMSTIDSYFHRHSQMLPNRTKNTTTIKPSWARVPLSFSSESLIEDSISGTNLRTLVKDQKNEYFINDLSVGSEFLRQSYQRFFQGVGLKGYPITSTFELRDTQAVIVRPDGSWTRSGEKIRVVTQESATYALPTRYRPLKHGKRC